MEGATPRAVGFAVDAFLEREIGVRWLFPGDLGTYVPTAPAGTASLAVLATEWRAAPAYDYRLISAPPYEADADARIAWLERMRLTGPLPHPSATAAGVIHHAFQRIFSPAQYL